MRFIFFLFFILSLLSCALNEAEIKQRDFLMNNAAYQYEGKRYAQAEELVLKVKEIEPHHFKADLMLGFIYHFRGKYKHAQTQFEDILKNHPVHSKAHHGMAMNYFQQGNQKRRAGIVYEGELQSDYSKALDHYLKALKYEENLDLQAAFEYQIALTHIQIALDHLNHQGRLRRIRWEFNYPEKKAEFKNAEEKQRFETLRALDEGLLNKLATRFKGEGSLDEILNKEIQVHYGSAKKQFNESIQHLNHYDKNLMARLTAVEAELKTKTDSAKVVRSHETQHETQQYLLDQKQGLIKNRTNALSLIGMIHFRTRNYDQALNVLQRISEFDPENPIIHLNTGLTLIRKAETLSRQLQNQEVREDLGLRAQQDLVTASYAKARDELKFIFSETSYGSSRSLSDG
jgi:tetratricopeptide (TPR) repeat protein